MDEELMRQAGGFWVMLGVIFFVTLGALAWSMFLPVVVKTSTGKWIVGVSGYLGQKDRVVYMEDGRFRIWDGSAEDGVWYVTYDTRQRGVMWDRVGGGVWPGEMFLTERVRLARRKGEYLFEWTGISTP